jgi:creatinine amidohydrolase
MPETSIRFWQSLTTADVRRAVAEDPVVVLPLAAIEQHGPHLPLSTDLDIGMGLLASAFRQLPDDFPAWVLPPQAVGCSREHVRFPGTLSLEPELVTSVVYQLGAAVAGAGVGRMVLCNSHGGNRQLLDAAGLRLREHHGLLVVKVSYFDLPRPSTVDVPESEWRHGLHGGAVETAMMMHLRPELVRTRETRRARSLGVDLEKSMTRLGAAGPASFSWLADDLSGTGVTGDASLADAAMGERLVAYYGKALAEIIRDARAFPLERLAERRSE